MQSILERIDRWCETPLKEEKVEELDGLNSRIQLLHAIFCYFMFYSFLGWLWETIITSIDVGSLQERGFLHLPICPIYGVAIVIIITLFYKKRDNWPLVFLGSGFVTSIVEYITSWGMEKIFHRVWWDYSQMRFQINGRISLVGTVTFGIASILVLNKIHPILKEKTYRYICSENSLRLSIGIATLILVDTIITCIMRLK